MANEFAHKDVGDDLSKAEWLGLDTHQVSGQAEGDILYCDGTYWKRLAKGTSGLYLKIGSNIPEWANPMSALTEQGDIPYASAAGVLAALAHGTVGQVLISGGHGANPSWANLAFGAINISRDCSVASGDISYTGVGFLPKYLFASWGVHPSPTATAHGFSNAAKASVELRMDAAGAFSQTTSNFISLPSYSSSGQYWCTAIVKSYDSNGFTLTWTRGHSYSSGTYYILVLCIG